MDENLTIGKKIWQEAHRQKFSKAKFSKEMGISRQTLDNWISQATSPDYNEVEKASKILDVELSSFVKSENRLKLGPPDYTLVFIETIKELVQDKNKEIERMEKVEWWALDRITELVAKVGVPNDPQK